MVTAGDSPHLCAVTMEFELFNASKLPVSYKASIMKRVNEIKRWTGQRELYVALIPHTADKCSDVSAGQTLMTSVEDPCHFKHESSPVDSAANDDAVPDTLCDKNNVASSFSAPDLSLPKEGDDHCDTVKFDNIQKLCSNVESSFMSETMASDRSANFVDDCDCQKRDLHDSCNTQDHVNPSRDVDRLSVISVKSESTATDTMLDASTSKSLKKKSVRISSSPCTVRYINCQRNELCNGASSSIVKVS